MAKIVFNQGLGSDETGAVSQASLGALSAAADASRNPEIRITSTIRLPERQARIMYDNLSGGAAIRYAAPGREVCAVYRELKKQGLSRDGIIAAMTARITDLAAQGQRVSKHCATPGQYAALNVIDVSVHMPNPRDFANALAQDDRVERIITPVAGAYASPRISHDPAEPAIHIEIRQQP